MKNLAVPLLATLFLLTAGCSRHDNVQEMLQDENERKQVYNTILEDDGMRNEMMAMMRDKNMGAGMMRSGGLIGDTAGMAQVHRQQMQLHMQQVMALCESDTAACHEMSRMLLQNKGMMQHMMQRMQQQGLIDTTCLQQMRQRTVR